MEAEASQFFFIKSKFILWNQHLFTINRNLFHEIQINFLQSKFIIWNRNLFYPIEIYLLNRSLFYEIEIHLFNRNLFFSVEVYLWKLPLVYWIEVNFLYLDLFFLSLILMNRSLFLISKYVLSNGDFKVYIWCLS